VGLHVLLAAQDFLVKTMNVGSGGRENLTTVVYCGGDPATAISLRVREQEERRANEKASLGETPLKAIGRTLQVYRAIRFLLGGVACTALGLWLGVQR